MQTARKKQDAVRSAEGECRGREEDDGQSNAHWNIVSDAIDQCTAERIDEQLNDRFRAKQRSHGHVLGIIVVGLCLHRLVIRSGGFRDVVRRS